MWQQVAASSLYADTAMATAGRIVMARLLEEIVRQEPGLVAEADAEAIHETRKAIRRLRTAFRVWAPYFADGELDQHRRCLKKTMRRLGTARDLHVFVDSLEADSAARQRKETKALAQLATYWRKEKREADQAARKAVTRQKHRRCLERFQRFLESSDVEMAGTRGITPYKVRHLAPLHVYERLAAVRAFDDYVEQADVPTLHRLRIQFKEFRYTLSFFAPLLAAETATLLAELDEIQDHLGYLNDTRVALSLLAQTPQSNAEGRFLYQAVQEAEARRLQTTFLSVWRHFNSHDWRFRLGVALAVL